MALSAIDEARKAFQTLTNPHPKQDIISVAKNAIPRLINTVLTKDPAIKTAKAVFNTVRSSTPVQLSKTSPTLSSIAAPVIKRYVDTQTTLKPFTSSQLVKAFSPVVNFGNYAGQQAVQGLNTFGKTLGSQPMTNFPYIKNPTILETIKTFDDRNQSPITSFLSGNVQNIPSQYAAGNKYRRETESLIGRRNLTPDEQTRVNDYLVGALPIGGIQTAGRKIGSKVGSTIAEQLDNLPPLRQTRPGSFTNVREVDNPLLTKEGRDRIAQTAKDTFKNIGEKFSMVKQTKDPLNRALPFDDVVSKATNVRQKVNLLDYVRTPANVLKKIGLGKEAELLDKKYNDYLDELPLEIDKVTRWSKRAPNENQAIFQWLDGNKGVTLSPEARQVATEIQTYLKQWAVKLQLPADKQITNYITHIFEKDVVGKEFPDELAKIIQEKVPGSIYNPFTQQRTGKPQYKTDTWQALDAYVKRATRAFHMDQALEQVSMKAVNLETSQYNYIKRYVDRVNMRPTELENLVDNFIKSTPIGYRAGQRPTTAVTQTARQAVYRGLIGLNVRTALQNLTQASNTYAKLGEKHTLLGYSKVAQNLPKFLTGAETELEQAGILRNNIIQDRTINATRKFWENADKGLFYMFNLAEKINRGAAYWGAKSKALSQGKSEEEAIKYAKEIVNTTQFDYGRVATPVVLGNDLSKTLFQFAQYPVKQTEFLAGMIKNKEFPGLIRWAGANLFLTYTLGKLWGAKPEDMIPVYRFGTPPTLQLPIEAGKAILGVPDKYGNEQDPNVLTRLAESRGIKKGIANYIPGGGQLFKTGEAATAQIQGGDYTKSGNLKFEQPPSVQGLLFGKYATPEGQEYLKKLKGEGLSQPEQQAQSFNNEFQEEQATQNKQTYQMYQQLKQAGSPDARRALLSQWNEQGLLTDELLDSFDNFAEQDVAKNDGEWAKALRKSSTSNSGRAKFILKSIQGKTPDEKRELFKQLEEAGLLTNELLDAIDEELLMREQGGVTP